MALLKSNGRLFRQSLLPQLAPFFGDSGGFPGHFDRKTAGTNQAAGAVCDGGVATALADRFRLQSGASGFVCGMTFCESSDRLCSGILILVFATEES
jgi:hypothetical protein